jgi:hypothetical protein
VINSFSLPFFAGLSTLFITQQKYKRFRTFALAKQNGDDTIKAHSLSPSSLDLELSSQIQQSKNAPWL